MLLGPMRILAHMHTMNDASVIEQLLEGLRRQTQPIDAILIVDNASTDGTLDRTFPKTVTIIRIRKTRARAARCGWLLPTPWSTASTGSGSLTLTAFRSPTGSKTWLHFSSV